MAEEARSLAQDQGQQLSRCLDADSDIRADFEGLLSGRAGESEGASRANIRAFMGINGCTGSACAMACMKLPATILSIE